MRRRNTHLDFSITSFFFLEVVDLKIALYNVSACGIEVDFGSEGRATDVRAIVANFDEVVSRYVGHKRDLVSSIATVVDGFYRVLRESRVQTQDLKLPVESRSAQLRIGRVSRFDVELCLLFHDGSLQRWSIRNAMRWR
eukprot:TRINITY_DN7966_c0_g1_i1.p1 TRINITY_DN7966_c0_g1~~TRINITY_DN7966_c0_g1_i1.p1  ORF type:complete len:161 (-),score=18.48 TRINITY_DN7966_c0_g1_i1:177-593(-)